MASLDTCRQELATLPAKINMEPATYMLTLLTEYCETIRQYVRGTSDSSGLIHENRAAYAAFRTAIRKTIPCFVPSIDASRAESGVDGLSDNEDDDEGAPTERIAEQQKMYLNDVRKHIARYVWISDEFIVY